MDRRLKNIAYSALALSLLSSQAAFTAPSNSTWTGATGNGLMSTAGNWSAAPTSDPATILTFPGTLANGAYFTVKDGLGAAFQIGTLTITGNTATTPTYNISPNAVNDSLQFPGVGTITVNAGAGTNTQTNTLSIPIDVPNPLDLDIHSLNGMFAYSGAFTGIGTVIFHGTVADTTANHGAIILQGDNTGKTGGFGLADNVYLAFTSANALGPTVANDIAFVAGTTSDGGTLLPQVSGITLNHTIVIFDPSVSMNFDLASIPSGTLEATNLSTNTGTIFGVSGAGAATPGGTLTLSGASLISGAGTSVTLTSNPVLILNTGANTYTGATTITSGTLQAAGVNVFSNASIVSIAGDPTAVLDLNNFNNEIGGLEGGLLTGGTVDLGSGTLKLKGSALLGYSGSIIGTGGVTLDAGPTGILQLGGLSTYSGTTTITQGTLQAGAANGFSPNSPVVIANHASSTLDLFGYDNTIYSLAAAGPDGTVTLGGGTLTISGSATTTFAGAITQSGGLILNGTWPLLMDLDGPNTYSGPTSILIGALAAQNVNTLSPNSGITLANHPNADLIISQNNSIAYLAGGGSSGGNVTLVAGTLTLLGFTSAPFGGQLMGGGALTLNGSGTLQLTGLSNSYSGNTTITSGTLQAGATNTFSPDSPIILANSASARLDLNNFNNTILALSGGGALGGNVSLGSGTLTISGAFTNTYSGAITGSGELTLNAPANVLTLSAASGTSTYSGTTSVVAGTLTAGGANSLSPNSIVSLASGTTLDITAAGNEIANLSGAAGATVDLGNNTLRLINDTHSETYNGAITGVNGGLRVSLASAGSITLGGTNSYGGNTLLESGTLVIASGGHTTTALAHSVGGLLEVNGILTAPSTQIDAGSTLRGTGTINGPSTVEVHGTISPGNSIGTLTIVGTYEQFSGSTFLNEISPTATDLLAVSGAVTINSGATFSVFPEPGTYDPTHNYIVITGNPRTGTFSNLTVNTIFLSPTLSYPVNQVVLNVTQNPIALFAPKGNPHKVAVAFDTLLNEGSSAANSIYADIFYFSASEVIRALDQMHPAQLKAHALIQESNALNVRNALTNHLTLPIFEQHCPILPQKEKASACACPEKKPFNAWIEGLGDWLRQSATHYASSHQVGYTDFMGGVVLGADYQFTDTFNAGLLGAYTHSDTHWLAHQGHGTIDSAYGGAYLSAIGKRAYAMASVIGSWSDYHRDRNIRFPGVNKTAQSSTDGYQVVSSLEVGFLGHRVEGFGLTLTPFNLFDYIAQNEKGFREHHADVYDLKVKKSDATMLRNELGLNIFRCECSHNVRWIFDAKISWVREMRLHAGHYTASFTETDVPFTVTGYMPDRNLVSPGASITALLNKKNLSVNAYYNGLYGNKFSENSIGAGLTYNY